EDPRNHIYIQSIHLSGEAFTGRPVGIDAERLILAADETRQPALRSLARTMVALALVGRGEAQQAVDLVHEALAIAGPGLNRDSINMGREVLALAAGPMAGGKPESLGARAASALELGEEYPLSMGFAIIGLLRSAHV